MHLLNEQRAGGRERDKHTTNIQTPIFAPTAGAPSTIPQILQGDIGCRDH